MGRPLLVSAVLALLVGATAGAAAGVAVDAYPQRVTLSDHEVTAGKSFSVDDRTTTYSGTDVGGYDVTIRNDGSTQLTVNVTVRMATLDGTVVANASKDVTVLTGATATVSIQFDAPVGTGEYDRVLVEASA